MTRAPSTTGCCWASRGPWPKASSTSEVELAFGHGPLEAQQHPVVEGARVIKAVLVADQGAGHGADLQELMPVGVVAGQPGALQAQHDPGPAEGHLGDQLLEPFPVGGRGAGLALVDV